MGLRVGGWENSGCPNSISSGFLHLGFRSYMLEPLWSRWVSSFKKHEALTDESSRLALGVQ